MDLENIARGVYHLADVSTHQGGYQRQPPKSFHLGKVNTHAVCKGPSLKCFEL